MPLPAPNGRHGASILGHKRHTPNIPHFCGSCNTCRIPLLLGCGAKRGLAEASRAAQPREPFAYIRAPSPHPASAASNGCLVHITLVTLCHSASAAAGGKVATWHRPHFRQGHHSSLLLTSLLSHSVTPPTPPAAGPPATRCPCCKQHHRSHSYLTLPHLLTATLPLAAERPPQRCPPAGGSSVTLHSSSSHCVYP